MKETISIYFESFDNKDQMNSDDRKLLEHAQIVLKNAYAPYSHFRVGAVAILSNGSIVTGTNQENASFPAGICAERVLLSAVSSMFPTETIFKMAISYEGDAVKSDKPISPCGVCRQALVEYESRADKPIKLILGGQTGNVYVFNAASDLLPMAFTPQHLGR